MAVPEIIASQQAYASDAIESANEFLGSLSTLASSGYFFSQSNAHIPSPGFGFDDTQETEALLLGLFPDAIDVDDITGASPTFTPSTVDPMADVPVADFTGVAPTLAIPQAPSSALPSVPVAPAISDPVLPTSPVVALPIAPVLAGISLPEPPSIALPSFTATLPIDDLVTPTNNFTFFEELYASQLLDELKAKLLDDLLNGGYGIENADESALWERLRGRELEGAQAEAEALLTEAASRGFPLPPGDLNVMLQRAQQKVQDKLSTANREIGLKRADMFVENRKFTIEQTRQLEQILIGFHNSRMERSLNAAKAILDASISIFNAQVSRYNARLDTYKTEAQVFEARVRASLAQTEIYRVTMEGKRIELDVQRARVEVYNAQLNGVNSVVNLYKTQMEAAQVQASIERLRIDAFQALISAYASQVQAKVAEFGMFESQVRGEIAKVTAYQTEAQAYAAVVSGSKAKADVAIARLNGQVAVAKNSVDVYQARIEEYKANIAGQAQTIDAKVRVFGSQVQAGSAKAGAVTEALKLEVTKKDLEFRRNVENARVALADAENFLKAALGSADIRMRSAGAAAGYYQALVGSAVNSINTLSALVATG